MHSAEEPNFEFEKLEVYQVAEQIKPRTDHIMSQLPSGYGDLKHHIRGSERSIRLNIGEGAGKRSPGGKAARFRTARGSANELAAALDEIRRFDLASSDHVRQAMILVHRVISMLTKLIMRWEPEEPE